MKCSFCERTDAQYLCPKCSKNYCSLSCYKSSLHSRCVEKFSKQQVDSHMSKADVSDMEKEHIVRIIEKYQKGDGWKYQHANEDNKRRYEQTKEYLNMKGASDEALTAAEEEELEQLIEGSSVDDLLKMLSPEERNQFENMIRTQYEIVNETDDE